MLMQNLGGKAVIYVDDTTILLEGDSQQDLETKARNMLLNVRNYFVSLNLVLNLDKTVILLFGNSNVKITIDIKGTIIESAESTKFLGMEIHRNLKWNDHIDLLESKLCKNIFVLNQLNNSIQTNEVRKTYFSLFQSHLTYGLLLWAHNITELNYNKIFKLQKTAVRIVKFGSKHCLSCRGIFKELNILTLASLYILQNLIYAKRKLENNLNSIINPYCTRQSHDINIRLCPNSIAYTAGKMFNKLPRSVRTLPMKNFKKKIKKWLIDKELYSIQEFWELNCSDDKL